MAFDNDYYVNNRAKMTRKIALRGITFLIVVFIAILNVVILLKSR